MLPEALQRARALLENITPLRTDCGLTCGGACCRPLEGEMTGMLLFPGEEAYYEGREGYRMTTTDQGTLLICSGRCNREDRPLSCRLMPLIPLIREVSEVGQGANAASAASRCVKVATDLRAKTVCPLARQGKDALAPEFVSAVREVGQLLAEDETQRAFLTILTRQQDELKALRNQFRRGSHV